MLQRGWLVKKEPHLTLRKCGLTGTVTYCERMMPRIFVFTTVLAFLCGCTGYRSQPPKTSAADSVAPGSKEREAELEFAIPNTEVLNCVTVSTVNNLAAIGTMSGRILLIDVGNVGSVSTLQAKEGNLLDSAILCVAFSPSGKLLMVGCADHTVRVFDIAAKRQVISFAKHCGPIRSVAFSPKENRALSGSTSDYVIWEWDIETGKEIRRFQGKESPDSLAISLNGDVFVTTEFMNLQFWEGNSGRRLGVLSGHTSRIKGVFFSPHGDRLISVSLGEIRIWDFASASLIQTFGDNDFFVNSAALSSDGALLLVGLTNEIQLWDIASRARLASIGNLAGNTAVTFAPDNRFALTAEMWGRARMWRLPSSKAN